MKQKHSNVLAIGNISHLHSSVTLPRVGLYSNLIGLARGDAWQSYHTPSDNGDIMASNNNGLIGNEPIIQPQCSADIPRAPQPTDKTPNKKDSLMDTPHADFSKVEIVQPPPSHENFFSENSGLGSDANMSQCDILDSVGDAELPQVNNGGGLSVSQMEDFAERLLFEEGVNKGAVYAELGRWIGSDTSLRTMIGYILRGASVPVAASLCGFTMGQVRGFAEGNEGFNRALSIARGFKDIRRIGQIEGASDSGDWKASAWLLKHDMDTRRDYMQEGKPSVAVQVNNNYGGDALRKAIESVEGVRRGIVTTDVSSETVSPTDGMTDE